jgi:hypothetical protein
LLKQIIYTTNWRVRRLLRSGGATAVTDLNREAFLARCKGSGGISNNRKARFVQQLAASRMLGGAVLWAASLYVRLREGGSEMLALKRAQNSF